MSAINVFLRNLNTKEKQAKTKKAPITRIDAFLKGYFIKRLNYIS